MALPTASLGGLASLNVPTYIPTIPVTKQPKLWERAVAELLTQAAGQAVSTGINNLTQRDYATEFGQTPSGGFDRLLHGAQVDEKQAMQLRSQQSAKDLQTQQEKYGKESQMRDITGRANQSKFEAVQAMLRQAQDIEARTTMEQLTNQRNDAEIGSRERISGNELQMKDRLSAADIRAQQALAEIQALRAQRLKEAELNAEGPLRGAQTRKANAEATQTEKVTELTSRALQDNNQPGKPGTKPSPAVAEYARRQAAPLTGPAAYVAQRLQEVTNPPPPASDLDMSAFNTSHTREQVLAEIARRLGLSQ